MNFFSKKLKKINSKQEDSLINPKILEVNLIKDEIGVEFDWSKHLLSLFVTVFIAVLLVVEVYYGLDWWQKQEDQKTADLNTEYGNVKRQIANINSKSQDVTIFKDKLVITKKMADAHIYYTDLFSWLEKDTLNSIAYNGFEGDVSGAYNLSANTINFSDISWQAKTFRDDKFVDSVRVDSGSFAKNVNPLIKNDKPINFNLDMQVKPEIFIRQPE